MNDVFSSRDKLSLLMFFAMSISSFLSGNSWVFSAALVLLLPSGLMDLWVLPALAWAGKCCSMTELDMFVTLDSDPAGKEWNPVCSTEHFCQLEAMCLCINDTFAVFRRKYLWPFQFEEMKISCISTKGLMKLSIRGRELELVVLVVNSFNWKKKILIGEKKKLAEVMNLWGCYLLLALEMCSIFLWCLSGPVLFALQLVDNPLILFTGSVGYDAEKYFIALSHEACTCH